MFRLMSLVTAVVRYNQLFHISQFTHKHYELTWGQFEEFVRRSLGVLNMLHAKAMCALTENIYATEINRQQMIRHLCCILKLQSMTLI